MIKNLWKLLNSNPLIKGKLYHLTDKSIRPIPLVRYILAFAIVIFVASMITGMPIPSLRSPVLNCWRNIALIAFALLFIFKLSKYLKVKVYEYQTRSTRMEEEETYLIQ